MNGYIIKRGTEYVVNGGITTHDVNGAFVFENASDASVFICLGDELLPVDVSVRVQPVAYNGLLYACNTCLKQTSDHLTPCEECGGEEYHIQ